MEPCLSHRLEFWDTFEYKHILGFTHTDINAQQVSIFIVMKDHKQECNCVAHSCVLYICSTTIKLDGTEGKPSGFAQTIIQCIRFVDKKLHIQYHLTLLVYPANSIARACGFCFLAFMGLCVCTLFPVAMESHGECEIKVQLNCSHCQTQSCKRDEDTHLILCFCDDDDEVLANDNVTCVGTLGI